jgi:hypothetical protein
MPGPAQRGRSGGAGTAGGVEFQAGVVAWFVCAILAEQDVPPLWGWPENSTFESVVAEVDEPTDDVLVINSAGDRAFLQAKLRVTLATTPESALGSAVNQFVGQQLLGAPSLGLRDRLVLAAGSASSNAIREHLPRALDRLAGLQSGQPLAAAARNADERKALTCLVAHVNREWLAARGTPPTDAELRAFLARLRISEFDLRADGHSSREAQGMLRRSVLRQRDHAGVVFGLMVATGVSFSTRQTGADRASLHTWMNALGVAVRAAPGFRDDIDKLESHTGRTIERLSRFASIATGNDSRAKITRTAPGVLLEVADCQSVVVTGDPGAGKSATLFELAVALREGGRDLVVLASDTLAAGSLGQLRDEFDLDHGLVDVLLNWPGERQGVLVIDALDAARGEHTQQALLDLIGAVAIHAPRWHLVVSIRRFDLRYNQDLQALFAGPTPAGAEGFETAEFAALSHFHVPLLSDAELGQLESLAPDLGTIVGGATPQLRELLRVPFNLRLLAELSALGVARAELTPIITQLQLLDKYWLHRIVGQVGGDARETVLRAVSEGMLAGQTLRVARAALQTDVAVDPPLNELLGGGVLVEDESTGTVQRDLLTFAHHVLFDYSCARLVLRGTAPDILGRTRANVDLLLVARPSYDLHFRHLWEQQEDHRRFWDLALAFATTAEVPAIGRIVAPTVGAQLVDGPSDWAHLVAIITGRRSARRDAADEVLRHLVAARLASGPLGDAIPPDRRHAWAELASALAEGSRIETAYVVRNLLMELTTRADRLEASSRRATGRAARASVEWAFGLREHHTYLIRTGIAAVARTFTTDPTTSEALLRKVISADRLKRFGFIELPALSNEMSWLVDVAPALAADIYTAAFDHQETSDEPTAMGGGVVIPLTSNRRQDYEHAHYVLAEAFPEFLRRSPSEAIDALSAVRRAFAQRRATSSLGVERITIPWSGDLVEVEPDGSYYRDRQDRDYDDEDKMLTAFGTWLAEIAQLGRSAIRDVLTTLRSRRHPASIWCRTLRVAADNPSAFGPTLEPVLVAPEALSSAELGPRICSFLRQGFAHLPIAARRRVEGAILSLPDTVVLEPDDDPVRRRDLGVRARDRILSCLPDAAVVSASARKQLGELRAAGVKDPGEPDRLFEFGSRALTDDDHLREVGVDIDAAPNRTLQELQTPLKEFAARYLNDTPPGEARAAIEAPLRTLWSAVQTADADGADPRMRDTSWGYAADASAAIARATDLPDNGALTAVVAEILVRSAAHAEPREPEDTGAFDETPSWGGMVPRIEAAQGLPCLAWHPELATPEVIVAIDDLSRDPHPAVRFHIAQRLALLLRTAPEAMWKIADRMLANDRSMAALQALVVELRRMTLPDNDVDRLQAGIRAAFARASGDARGAANVRETCAQAMVALYVGRGLDDARAFIDEILLRDLKSHPELAQRVVHLLRDPLTQGEVEPAAAADVELRHRAIDLAERLLHKATRTLADWEVELAGTGQLARDDPRSVAIQATAQVIDSVATEFFFATGIFDERQGKPTVSAEVRERLYHETDSLIDALCDVRFAPSAHHVLESLEAFIAFDPRGVFLRIARTVRAARASRYETDSLAVGLVVGLVERYLAEHRTLLQQDEECRRALVEVLDTFVTAGWPQAIQLTYGLQDLYR